MDADTVEHESREDASLSPQKRWDLEISAARRALEKFHEDGTKALKEYRGKDGKGRLNLWYADVQTKSSALGGEPKVRSRRRYADAKDDVARVSAEALERLLNTDVERDSDGFRRALRNAKGDWLKVALGQVRMRYVVQAGEDGTKKFEDVETDYIHWRDFLWSPCRTWDEVRWIAYRAEMSREALKERFGDDLGAKIPLNAKSQGKDSDPEKKDPWSRAEIWEIWSKEDKKVYWLSENFKGGILDEKDDPLGLPNFFPSPEPLAANLTTDEFIPRSPFFLAEDLYEEAHQLTRRIRALVKEIKVVGAYAKGNDALVKVLEDACENTLVPVSDIAALMGEDGLKNPVWFMPIKPQVDAVIQLLQQRQVVRSDIAEVLGLSDIMRGQQSQRVTATTDRIKARAFSMRSQTDQDEYARFASDAQRIRAFIISKQFDPATIIARSNIDQAETIEVPSPPVAPGMPPGPPQKTPNQKLINAAVQLLKDDISAYRIDVDGDSLSMTDFDAVQQDAIALMQSTAQYFQGMLPVAQAGGRPMMKLTLELYQTLLATFRGAERFEGVVDRAMADFEQAAAQPPPPPPPDPRLEAAKVKAQAEMGKAQATMQQTAMDAHAHAQATALDMQSKAQDAQMKQADFGMRMAELRAKQEAAADFAAPEDPRV